MNKLDTAISHLTRWAVENGEQEAEILAAAFEEIRDLLTADKQPAPTEEQPAPFLPWDCVTAKPGTYLYEYYADAELVCGFLDSDGDRKVFNPDDDSDRGAFHCNDSDLIFVRRLKPRKQAESQTKALHYVRDVRDSHLYEVVKEPINGFTDVRDVETQNVVSIHERHLETVAQTNNEDLLRAAGYVQKESAFKACDWVRHKHSRKTFQISSVAGEQIYGMLDGTTIATLQEFVEKIPTPAPRFKFGDRVRVEHDSDKMLFLYYDDNTRLGPGRTICVNERASICNVPAEKLLLDTSAD